ncbi:MAG: hypothetical protein WDN27_02250 [Candidatus Saccharibacteria bacterium]
MANLVIPSDATVQAATITTSGYNTARVNITAAGDLAKNTFAVTPAGRLYFLSNLSGKIDVVKTNLDGTDRQTVLAGTGNEDSGSTSLLASRDWKYLALLSRRSGDNASVYLIDTTNNDKLTTIDQGNADFSLVGWSGDNFVYQVTRNTISNWQAGQQALKSFDATSGETLLLDQTQASGTDQSNWMGAAVRLAISDGQSGSVRQELELQLQLCRPGFREAGRARLDRCRRVEPQDRQIIRRGSGHADRLHRHRHPAV